MGLSINMVYLVSHIMSFVSFGSVIVLSIAMSCSRFIM
jgi:hypothetical protein